MWASCQGKKELNVHHVYKVGLQSLCREGVACFLHYFWVCGHLIQAKRPKHQLLSQWVSEMLAIEIFPSLVVVLVPKTDPKRSKLGVIMSRWFFESSHHLQ